MIGRQSYRIVVLVLIPSALLGAIAALVGGLLLGNRVLLDAAVALGVATGVLVGVALTGGALPTVQEDAPAEKMLIAGLDPKTPFLRPSRTIDSVSDYDVAVAESTGEAHRPKQTARGLRARLQAAAAKVRQWRGRLSCHDRCGDC